MCVSKAGGCVGRVAMGASAERDSWLEFLGVALFCPMAA